MARRSLALIALGLVLIVVVSAWGRSDRVLRLEHDLLLWLRQRATVVALRIDPVGEIRMFLNPDDRMITQALLDGRGWETKETLWITRLVQKGDTFVDVGANVGYYTLIAAKLVGGEGRVFAFEPDPVSFELLERNVRLNGLTNVVLEQKAASDASGTIRLFIAPENKGDHRIFQPQDERRPSIEVEAVTLDEYFADHDRTIDFVKIDTQGAEVVILEGMKRILRENARLRMAIEFWPGALMDFGSRPDAVLAILDAARFRLFSLAGSTESPLLEITVRELRNAVDPRERLAQTNLLAVRRGAETESLRRAGARLRGRPQRARKSPRPRPPLPPREKTPGT